MKYLKAYSWKGNVRELENTVNRLLTMVPNSEITPDDLDAKFFNNTPQDIDDFNCDYPAYRKMIEDLAEDKEKEYILHRIRGAKSLRAAAKSISIPNTSLQHKLNNWGYSVKEVL